MNIYRHNPFISYKDDHVNSFPMMSYEAHFNSLIKKMYYSSGVLALPPSEDPARLHTARASKTSACGRIRCDVTALPTKAFFVRLSFFVSIIFMVTQAADSDLAIEQRRVLPC